MRVLCRHGHIVFYPRNAAEIGRFAKYFNVNLARERDYFTFEGLIGAPNYSIELMPFLDLPANTTYAGEPWDVMRENGFVFDIRNGLLIPKETVNEIVDLPLVGYFFRAGVPLLQPGSRNSSSGQQILSYSGEFVDEGLSLRVTEYAYE